MQLFYLKINNDNDNDHLHELTDVAYNLGQFTLYSAKLCYTIYMNLDSQSNEAVQSKLNYKIRI